MLNYYDIVTIRNIGEHCNVPMQHLWYSHHVYTGEDYSTERKLDETCPPISLVDIACFQTALYGDIIHEVGNRPFVGAFAIDWQNDAGTHMAHIARFDMKANYDYAAQIRRGCTLAADDLLREETEKQCLLDEYFPLIEAAYVAEVHGQLNVPLETFLQLVPEAVRYHTDKITLKPGYGTLILTVVSMVNDSTCYSDTDIAYFKKESLDYGTPEQDYNIARRMVWGIKGHAQVTGVFSE